MIGKLAAALLLSSAAIACGGGATGGGAGAGGISPDSGGTDGGSGGASGGMDDGTTTVVSCTITQTSSASTCIETAGALTPAVVDYLRMGCTGPVSGAAMAVQQFAIGPCTHAQALGACSTPSGTNISTTRWWYDDGAMTANDVRAACEALGDTYIAP